MSGKITRSREEIEEYKLHKRFQKHPQWNKTPRKNCPVHPSIKRVFNPETNGYDCPECIKEKDQQ